MKESPSQFWKKVHFLHPILIEFLDDVIGFSQPLVLVSNTNRDDFVIEARSLDDAITQMTIVDSLPPDRHPERRLKASFKV